MVKEHKNLAPFPEFNLGDTTKARMKFIDLRTLKPEELQIRIG